MNSSQPSPGGRVTRVGLHGWEREVARGGPLLRIVTELVAAQVVFVRLRIGRDIVPQNSLLARGELNRERIYETLRQLVLQAENRTDRGLRGVGAHQRPG